ncbi:MAG: NAD(P)-dependent oxidoreductase [Acidobacteria bacterium]|nr:NAD(P)-dependent oxidoreductase [Acidobacteriota bacterium]MBS1864667.1 NAD(P)-dependent oxidoreductase [Acidobacteriota bacterium]
MSTGNKYEENPEVTARFPDIHPPFDKSGATIEANRCLYCFDAPCTAACPTHIDVPRFIKKISQGNLRGSALTILDANILGASCSRVCPVDVLCEGACVYHRYNKQPIEIGRLQRFAMDAFYRNGAVLAAKTTERRAGKVACIGAGPASLAFAAELRQRGFSAAIFERKPLPGGLNTYGVAEYKLRASDSLREIDLIRELGVDFQFGRNISGEAALAALEREFDFIFLGVGLGKIRLLGIPGEELPGVVDALKFIEEYKTGRNLKVGGRVVVLGAGNTAIDAARAAVRLGAQDVQIVYRRDESSMSAFLFEYEHAREEGVKFRWWTQPVKLVGDEKKISGMECMKVEMDGQSFRHLPGSHFTIPCDMVISAIGQSPLLEFLQACRGVKLENGRVSVDRATGQTSHAKYFAGGDCVNGGREVVDAVADGKRAALAAAQLLEKIHG